MFKSKNGAMTIEVDAKPAADHKPGADQCDHKDAMIGPASPATTYVDDTDENQLRGNWTGKLDFILSCLSYAVGLGNVWRFPYQCYQNGGGAFVLPFLLMLIVTGIPLFFLESAFGQFASSGVVSIWKACPLFQGIGYAMFMVSFLVSVYYNVIIAWTFYYLIRSFTTQLPWATCDNEWNTPACRVQNWQTDVRSCPSMNGTLQNGTCVYEDGTLVGEYQAREMAANATNVTVVPSNETVSPSEEFFNFHVLSISSGVDDLGYLKWELALCLLLSWALVCICMIKGIKTSGRAVYFTATFPYLVLTILLVRGVTLPGSIDGIAYFFTPKWEKLKEAKVWCDAAVQIFFSLAPGWGGLITLSSYNKFKNNCLRDTYIVCVGDCLTSLFAGMVIFCIIGYMAFSLDKAIENVAADGPGLAFIAYPEVVTRLPASPLWAVLFFLMLITLGLGTQFAIVNTVHTTIIDMFPKVFHRGHRPSFLMIGLCATSFFMGLLMCTRGGMYWLELMDSYSATYSVLIIGLTECLVLAWVYGYDHLKADIKLMLGKQIGPYWMIMWKFVSPAALVGIFAFQCVQFQRKTYGSYVYPWWGDMVGWLITLSSVGFIPGVAIYKICTAEEGNTVIEKIRHLAKPTPDWGPSLFRTPITPTSTAAFDFPDTAGTKARHTSNGHVSHHGDQEAMVPLQGALNSTEAMIEQSPHKTKL